MDILIYLLIISAVVLIAWAMASSWRVSAMRLKQDNFIEKANKPFFDLSKLLPTRDILERTGLLVKIKNKIDAAHVNISPVAFFNLKIIIMFIFVFLSVIATGKIDPIFIFISLGIGYIAPEIYLKQKLAKRKNLISRRLPETVDLLGLCIEAGLDFVSAVRWVIDKTPGTAMTEELAFVVEEIKWGKPRIQALKDMSRRLDIPEMTSFVQTIIQADRMGTPVAEAFTIISEDARAQRFHRGQRIALQAPIKILLPLIFFIMPVIGIVIGGPILLQFMQGGLTGLK
ncbi:MAG: type II secretion system F family protein [Candidatus Omnitrophica bacterium]|nr:type II secretion system F family protein [Candidatus Omnitrophota bacterium]MDD5690581.1 type II secretion system F family protein [Candidatus Omnitrophota bacterium]